MKNNRLIANAVAGLIVTFLLSSCSHTPKPDLVGFSFLQDSETTMDSVAACISMQNLRSTGANSVVLVPFMVQDSPNSANVSKSGAVTDAQLIAALTFAKQNKLHLILKPQILVKDSWAGEISQLSSEHENIWFESYSQLLLHYAKIAETYHVDGFVIGTELKKIQASKHWPKLISAVRSVYSGKLTYAAGEVDGIEKFHYWQLLDAIGVTLYPDMTKAQITDMLLEQLQVLSLQNHRPIWILEVGMPSAKGWETRPWDWRGLQASSPIADESSQANIIQRWLTSLENSQATNIKGIWIWQWSSSPQAGGNNDVGYTIQNKSAQAVVHKHWRSPFKLFTREISTCTD